MAATKSTPSPYYPPRATAWSRFCTAVNRRWLLMRAPGVAYDAAEDVGMFFKGIPWLLVPGLMWRQQGRVFLGSAVMAVWVALVATYIASLNMGVANLAATIASTIHAISASAVFVVLCPYWQGISRIVRTVVYTMVLVLVIYSVGLRALIAPFAQRMIIGGNTVMIREAGWFTERTWNRGDWVAYRLLDGGTGADQIIALPGETIQFHRDSFEVNGHHFARLSELMPTDGEWTMRPGIYCVWPTVMRFHGDVDQMLLRFSEVPEGDIIGKPYGHWLGRPSNLEPLKPLSNPTP